jgi:hypothetical protein
MVIAIAKMPSYIIYYEIYIHFSFDVCSYYVTTTRRGGGGGVSKQTLLFYYGNNTPIVLPDIMATRLEPEEKTKSSTGTNRTTNSDKDENPDDKMDG